MTTKDYKLAYVGLDGSPVADGVPLLLCDPLTMLVAYPSFEAHLISAMPTVAPIGLHLAIGDVDGLREYVTDRRSSDPSSFGHLAGNDCMRRIGALTQSWVRSQFEECAFEVCGTFGGDEVIVAAAGCSHEDFVESIGLLCGQIRASAPRPCSFAVATLHTCEVAAEEAPAAYRALVSRVDAGLFDAKERWRSGGNQLDGRVLDIGDIAILSDRHSRYQEIRPCP